MNNILITGITGQDGLFLVKNLLKNKPNINIYGTTRDLKNKEIFFERLEKLNVELISNVNLIDINLRIETEVKSLIKEINPKQIYNLSGPSSVYESIKNPEVGKDAIIEIFLNLTNCLIREKNFCNFFQASSSEMFAKNQEGTLNEESLLFPNSPYGDSKLYCHNKVFELNDKYNWKIVSGIMFNHESEFRSEDFLMIKIINGAINILENNADKLEIGSVDYVRDWMHSEDTVRAMIAITNNPINKSYVIGSGVGNSIKDLVQIVFSYFDLDYEKYIKINPSLLRQGDSEKIIANPKRLLEDYSWQQKISFKEMIHRIIKFKLDS